MLRTAALVLCMVSAGTAAAQSLPPTLLTMTSGAAMAHFGGERFEEVPGDLRYSATAMWFTFAGDDQAYAVDLGEQEVLRNWDFNFDIFSPDGRHVLLLRDHYGPYHIVAVDRLKPYLKGEIKADFEISGMLPGQSTAGVHHSAHWASSTVVEFSFSCCASEHEMRFELDRTAVTCLRRREATDTTKGPWENCP